MVAEGIFWAVDNRSLIRMVWYDTTCETSLAGQNRLRSGNITRCEKGREATFILQQ